jgi:hypothetical protein
VSTADQGLLFDRVVGSPRDALGRFFTPPRLADIIVDEIAVRVGCGMSLVVEPSIGAGAFVTPFRRAFPMAHVVGVDLDPAAEGQQRVDDAYIADWLELAEEWAHVLERDVHHPVFAQRPDVIAGNPPFTKDSGRRNEKGEPIMEQVAHLHVLASLKLKPRACGFILPWSYTGGVDRWAELLEEHPPALLAPAAPRPWTKDVREVGLYLWIRDYTGPTVWQPLPRWR